MDKLMKIKVVTLAILLLLHLIVSVRGVEEEKEAAGESSKIIDASKSLFSLPTASWTFKLKTLFQQPWNLFSPPNLDFRGSSGGGATDQETPGTVKEAVIKSFDKSKTTVEDSAKSAAKFTVDNTVNRLKKTSSGEGQLGREEAEL